MGKEKKDIGELLKVLPRVRLSDDFEAKLKARLAEVEARRQRPSPWAWLQEVGRRLGGLFVRPVPVWAAATVPVLMGVFLCVQWPSLGRIKWDPHAAALNAEARFDDVVHPTPERLEAAIELIETNAQKHPDDPALQLKLAELYQRRLEATDDPAEQATLRTRIEAARQRAMELLREQAGVTG